MYKLEDPKLLKLLNVILHCTGLSIKTSSINILITVIKYLYIFVMFSTLVAGSILIFRLWLVDALNSQFDPNCIQLLVIHVSYIEGAFNFAFLMYWQWKKKFERHHELLLNANSLKGTVNNKYIKLLCDCLVVVSIVFIIFGVSSGVFLIESKSINFIFFAKLRFTFFDERLHYLVYINILYIVISITICFSLLSVTCFIDKMELKYMNEHMEKEEWMDAHTLKIYIDKHSSFVKVADQADNIFRFYIFKSFAIFVPLIVLILYDVAIGTVALEVKIIYGLAVAYYIIYTVVINMLSATVNREIWRTTEILFEKINCHHTEEHSEIYRIVTWFTHKSVHKPVGFTIGGIIHISNHLLLKAISIIATLLVFLIQTYPAKPSIFINSSSNDSST